MLMLSDASYIFNLYPTSQLRYLCLVADNATNFVVTIEGIQFNSYKTRIIEMSVIRAEHMAFR